MRGDDPMKITVRNIILPAFIAALLSGCSGLPFRGEPQVLNAAEVQRLFVGNTVESYNLNTGFNSFTYYHPNGQVLQERLWVRRKGSWSLQKDGRICLAFTKGKMKCRHIVRDGDVWRLDV